MILELTLPAGAWMEIAALYPSVPFFEVGQQLELEDPTGCRHWQKRRTGVVISWDLATRKLVLDMEELT